MGKRVRIHKIDVHLSFWIQMLVLISMRIRSKLGLKQLGIGMCDSIP